MKTFKLIIVTALILLAGSAKAQISVNINLGSPPQWGPEGYSEARYYYLPDVESYYDVQSSRFIYYDGRTWVHRTYLPSRYRNYDLYNGYKVVMTDYRGDRPYSNFREYRTKYSKGYRGHEQRNIGERPARGNSHPVYRSNRQVSNNSRGYQNNNGRSYQKNEGRGNNHVSQGNQRNEQHGDNNNKKDDRGNGHGNGNGKK